jgi:uncharacterized protein (TIGR00106 family)
MLAEFSVAPVGDNPHLSAVVAEMLRLIDASGLPYQFHSMGTIVEGEWDEVMDLIGRCHALAREGAVRVGTVIKIDDCPGRTGRLEGKVAGVENIVGKRLGRDSKR